MKRLREFWGPEKGQIDGRSLWASFRLVLIGITAFAIEQIAQWAADADFGVYQPVVVGVLMFAIQLGRKALKDYSDRGIPNG